MLLGVRQTKSNAHGSTRNFRFSDNIYGNTRVVLLQVPIRIFHQSYPLS